MKQLLIGHREEIRKLTFRALALRRIRSGEELTFETSAIESLHGGQFTLPTQLIKPNYPVPGTEIILGNSEMSTCSRK